MGLLNKIKNALFEEEVVEEKKPAIAKQIDSLPEKKPIINDYNDNVVEEKEEEPSFEHEKEKEPIIFDVEDFIEEKEETYEVPKKEGKILYGGYEVKEYEKMTDKDKFHPSPILSPVYGIMDKDYKKEETKEHEGKSLDHLFIEEKKRPLDFDTVRQKAYGYSEPVKEVPVEEDRSLLYDMQEEEKPGIEKISLGDAEEYFEDLGLEYNVDYTDLAKEKMTRSKKNKELTETIDEEIKETDKIETEIKKEVPVKEKKEDTSEEKNLYDLIDMMYEEK